MTLGSQKLYSQYGAIRTTGHFSPSLLLWADDKQRLVLYISFQNETPYLCRKGRAPFTAQQLQTWTYIEWYFQEVGGGKTSSRLCAENKYILSDEKLIFPLYIHKYHANREGNVRPWKKASSHHVSLRISKIKLPWFFWLGELSHELSLLFTLKIGTYQFHLQLTIRMKIW